MSFRVVVVADSMLKCKVGLQAVPIAAKDIAAKAVQWGLSGDRDPEIPAKLIPVGRTAKPFKVKHKEIKKPLSV